MGSPYKALADDTRREILKLLAQKELRAGEITEKFNISKPAISNHLKILIEADLLAVKKDKQQRIYSIEKVTIKDIIKFLNSLLK